MSAWTRWAAGLAWLALLSAQVSESVNITELRVPEVVEHNTNSTAILDCVYDLPDDGVNLLLVKWYFGDENHQVYQWGLGLEPAGSGVLKGRLHLGHVASPELLKKHRALSVSNPTVDLSGTYICRVMTNSGVVTEAKKMIVYAPARAMNLTQDKPSPSSVNITCVVEGVFPAPLLEVFAKREDKEDGRRLLSNVIQRTEATEEGRFDAVAYALVEDGSLEGRTTFECVMTIPETQYRLQRHISYASGATLAASIAGAAERAAAASSGLLAGCLLLTAGLPR